MLLKLFDRNHDRPYIGVPAHTYIRPRTLLKMTETSTKRGNIDPAIESNIERSPKRARIDEDSASDDDWEETTPAIKAEVEPRASDLYLDTVCSLHVSRCNITLTLYQINRQVLDFDFEKVCSVSLSNINIYGCLVCGKYFQGRGRNSYAYAHSIHDDHHVFINLDTTKVSLTSFCPSTIEADMLSTLGLRASGWVPCVGPLPGRYCLCALAQVYP